MFLQRVCASISRHVLSQRLAVETGQCVFFCGNVKLANIALIVPHGFLVSQQYIHKQQMCKQISCFIRLHWCELRHRSNVSYVKSELEVHHVSLYWLQTSVFNLKSQCPCGFQVCLVQDVHGQPAEWWITRSRWRKLKPRRVGLTAQRRSPKMSWKVRIMQGTYCLGLGTNCTQWSSKGSWKPKT